MEDLTKNIKPAELVRADTALQSFRDGGYSLTDAIGEIADNAIQAGARTIRFDWDFDVVKKGKSDKSQREMTSLAICDDGHGIPPTILPNVLTIGFSTRYNNRDGIGRFGVGFKLASISQAKRLEIYSKPAYLSFEEKDDASGIKQPVFSNKNEAGRIFKSYLDLDEITNHSQKSYGCEEVADFPEDYKHLMENHFSGTLIVWRKMDRTNESKAFAVSADEKLSSLGYFLSRTYRIYIDNGLKIYLPDKSGKRLFAFDEPLVPYDPTFQIDNPIADLLGKGESMRGEFIEEGEILIDKYIVKWKVYLTPKVTRLFSGGGGVAGPLADNQFKKLHIPDNQGKISFLRHDREISYTKVPYLIKVDDIDKNSALDRHIGIEVSFPPALDEYFQVRHIKRGIEPVDKLKLELRNLLNKPVTAARKRIRAVWNEGAEIKKAKTDIQDTTGGRSKSEDTAQASNAGMPIGRAGESVTPDSELASLLQIAEEVGIKDPEQQLQFAQKAQQKPFNAVDMSWSGKGLLDIEHLNKTVVVKINRKHAFIRDIYLPLKEVTEKDMSEFEPDYIRHMLSNALEGIDLLFFAYAKAENMNPDPEEAFMVLREDWGKFTAAYLKKREELNIA